MSVDPTFSPQISSISKTLTMIKTFLLFSLSTIATIFADQTMNPNPMNTATTSFHEFEIEGLIDGQINMADFKGKFILCVNVASRCGYTRQYEPLQQLYEQYQDQLVIIGFPCNQFGGQESGSASEIASFCKKNYGVSFPMTQKIDVKGDDQHPIYAWLTQESLNQVSDAEVSWNFNKFLISPEGKWLAHFPSGTDPLSEDILGYLK